VRVVDGLQGPHAALAPLVARLLGVPLHGRLALRRCAAAVRPLPSALVLRPVAEDAEENDALGRRTAPGAAEAPHGTSPARSLAGQVAALGAEQLRALVARWLAAQAPAGAGMAPGASERGLAVAPLAVMSLARGADAATRDAAHLVVESVAGADAGAPVLLTPEHVRGGAVRVELGPAWQALPPAPAGWRAAGADPGWRRLARGACFGQAWLERNAAPALLRLAPLLHVRARAALADLEAPPPGGLLICGAAGRWACLRAPCAVLVLLATVTAEAGTPATSAAHVQLPTIHGC